MASSNKFSIVEDSMESRRIAGAVVYWRLHGEANVEQVRRALSAHGVTEWPDEPSHADALRRACQQVTSARLLARPLPKGGFQLVREEQTGDEKKPLRWVPTLSCTLDAVQRLILTSHETTTDPSLQSAVRQHFAYALDHYTPGDVGGWLVRQVELHRGTALLPQGRFYFVGHDMVPSWQALAEVVAKCTPHVLYELPAQHTASLVRAVMDAVVENTEAEAVAMEGELDNGKLGSRALQTRADKANDLLTRVGRWGDLLGEKMAAVKERVERLKTAVGTAFAASLADDD